MKNLIRRLSRSFHKRLFRLRGAGDLTEPAPGLTLVRYGTDAQRAYEIYRAAQNEGNRRKLDQQWVQQSHIAYLAGIIEDRLGRVKFGLCHGTRQGSEQRWFRESLQTAPTILGTEIAESATQFPDTVLWDFHDENTEWIGAADFVYSNSWDHAFDPERAFRTWAAQLRPGGLMLLDHSTAHEPKLGSGDLTDPFAAELEALIGFLNTCCADYGEVVEHLESDDRSTGRACRVLVFQRRTVLDGSSSR